MKPQYSARHNALQFQPSRPKLGSMSALDPIAALASTRSCVSTVTVVTLAVTKR